MQMVLPVAGMLGFDAAMSRSIRCKQIDVPAKPDDRPARVEFRFHRVP